MYQGRDVEEKSKADRVKTSKTNQTQTWRVRHGAITIWQNRTAGQKQQLQMVKPNQMRVEERRSRASGMLHLSTRTDDEAATFLYFNC